MNCWPCDGGGVAKAAVASCPVCGVGLCRSHRLAQARGLGGTGIECRHIAECVADTDRAGNGRRQAATRALTSRSRTAILGH
jgi:Uncharacterized protein conserved in archaea (DUF2180)